MDDRRGTPNDPTLIFEVVHGSTAFGLAREGSDVDVKGIVVGPKRWYLGLASAPEQIDLSPDHVRYEVRKFMRLAADANPTFLEMLFVDERHHRVVNASGSLLLEHRDAFVSKQVGERFGGYALAQLKRIRSHRAYLLSPPTHSPTRAEFGLPDRTVIPADQLAAAEALLVEGATQAVDAEAVDVSPNFFDLLMRERRYKTAMKGWQSYQQWLRSRNPKRSALEARFGYDTKHAMHLIRLQRMALEILRTGQVLVERSDRDELWAIRDGSLTFDALEERCEEVDRELREAMNLSMLPDRPDESFLEKICMHIIESEAF